MNLEDILEKRFERIFPKTTRYLREWKDVLDNRKSDGEWFGMVDHKGLKFMNQEN